jgi:hypothetical protein
MHTDNVRLFGGCVLAVPSQRQGGLLAAYKPAPRKGRVDGGSSLMHRRNRQRPSGGDAKHIKGASAGAPRTLRLSCSSMSPPSAQVENTMGECFLARRWALLKLELHRLVRSLRRRRGLPDFTRPWHLAEMEFDASVQGPSIGRSIRGDGIFSPTSDGD